MFKKFLSLALVVMMIMSVIAISASAAQVEVADDAAAAEDVASQGADSDTASQGAEADAAPTGDGDGDGLISFDAASAGWSGAKWISFYIYEIGGANLTEWGGKNKDKTTNDGDIWSFDAKAAGVVEGKEYGVIFENLDTTAQTADLLLNTSCFGDTGYVPNPDDKIENAVDSNKKSMIAKWKNSSLGPIKQITSLGNIVGESIPSTTSAYQMMVNFLASKGSQSLQNALNYNGKDAQTTIDDTAKALGLNKSDVAKAIAEAKDTGTNDGTGDKTDWSDKWDASKSSLPEGEGGGTTSSTGSSSSSSGSSSTSGSSSKSTTTTSTGGSSGSSSSSSSTKSGSASNTQTGQEETVLFIMLGVMVAAAGVIIFARKRERA